MEISDMHFDLSIFSNKKKYDPTEEADAAIRDLKKRLELARDLIGKDVFHITIEISKLAKAALDNARDSILIINKEGRIIYVNPYSCKMLGYEERELLGKPYLLIEPNETTGRKESDWKSFFKSVFSNKCLYYDTVFITRNDHKISCNVKATNFEFDGHELIFVISRDLTERLKLNANLFKLQNSLLSISNQMPIAYAIIETERSYLSASQEWINFFEISNLYNTKSILGINHNKIIKNKDFVNKSIDSCFESKSSQEIISEDIRCKCFPLLDQDEEINGIFIIVEKLAKSN